MRQHVWHKSLLLIQLISGGASVLAFAQSPSPMRTAELLAFPSAAWPRRPSEGEIVEAYSAIQSKKWNINGQDMSALAEQYTDMQWQKMHTLQPRRNHVIVTYKSTYYRTYSSMESKWRCMALGYGNDKFTFIPVGMKNFETKEALDSYVSMYQPGWIDDEPAAEGGDSEVPDWVLVVGGSAALGAAVTAIVKSLRKAKKKAASQPDDGKKKDEDKPKDHAYILQLSADRIALEAGKPAPLMVTAWRVEETGKRTQARNAALRIVSTEPAVQVAPAEGLGTIQCSITVNGSPRKQPVILSVTGTAEGKQLTAQVQVTVPVQYRLEVA
jgi:hypothetical protein